MGSVFGVEYANQYDVLYRDKDYPAECDFLEQVFKQYSQQPVKSILDLGCGTGGHVIPLAHRGYQVSGVDRSEAMLASARQKAADASLQKPPAFYQSDIYEFKIDQTFDAVISMFAVMSYMVSNDSLLAALRTAREHLLPGGLFFFDAWFGPAVLAERPADRWKNIPTRGGQVIRFVHPEMDLLAHCVTVNYQLLHIIGDYIEKQTQEAHQMRYLFPQEIAFFLKVAGFQVITLCPFFELGRQLDSRDWTFSVVARAVAPWVG